MQSARSLTFKRLALAAAVSGAAFAATPALANAASTCTYSPDAFPAPRVDVFDGSGSFSLKVERSGQFIAVSDGGGAPKLCAGAGTFATVTNTDQIKVHGTAASTEGAAFFVDQSAGVLGPGKTPESDGNSEIETFVVNDGVPTHLFVVGTGLADTMRVSSSGGVMLGPDSDVDVRAFEATSVELQGRGGGDYLSGRGGYPASSPAPATTTVRLFGEDGNDTLVDGPLGSDSLSGDAGNDTLFTHDSQSGDCAFGGADFDTATVDDVDCRNSIEQLTQVVGRLKLDRTAVGVRAGRPARLTIAWRHPKAWKQVRSLKLSANEAGIVVGSIKIEPARSRITGHGALAAARGSTVGHRGKTVIAHLRLRASTKLAGRTLRLAVQASDAHGHKQLEPSVGSLTVR